MLGLSGCKDNKLDNSGTYSVENPITVPSKPVSINATPVNIDTENSPTQMSNLEIAELYLPLFECYKNNVDLENPNAMAMMESKELAAKTVELFKSSSGQDRTLKLALAQYNETIDLYTYRLLDDYWEACHNTGGSLGSLPEKRKAILKQADKQK